MSVLIPVSAKAELEIGTLGTDAYALRMRHPAGDNLFNAPHVLFNTLFPFRCQFHLFCLVQQGIVHDALCLNSFFPEVVKIVHHLAQVGFFHLFRLLNLVQLHDTVTPLHKIDADGIIDGDILLVPVIPFFMQQLSYIDVLVLLFKGDVVGEEPQLGVADVVVVDLDTGDFHVGCERMVCFWVVL